MSSLGYEEGLKSLWGDEAFAQLRKYVMSGEIDDAQVRTLAERMAVKVVYDQNHFIVDIPETFDRMLKKWYDQALFRLESTEAKRILVDILDKSRCSKKIVSTIGPPICISCPWIWTKKC